MLRGRAASLPQEVSVNDVDRREMVEQIAAAEGRI
jgi:hypothetical protein